MLGPGGPQRREPGPSAQVRGGTYSAGTMHFRPATSSDVPAILDMMEDFNRLEHIPWQRGPGRGAAADPDRLARVSAPWSSASTATLPLGYFVLTWGFDLEWGGRDAFLTELYLRAEVRGGGRGRLFLDAALAPRPAPTGPARVHLDGPHRQHPRPRALPQRRLHRPAARCS